uniref:Uncharacterized protein n=1 Tax=Rhizophora mucronata TaxID=61149 RepID=A0A2P2PMG1_RHIMU
MLTHCENKDKIFWIYSFPEVKMWKTRMLELLQWPS